MSAAPEENKVEASAPTNGTHARGSVRKIVVDLGGEGGGSGKKASAAVEGEEHLKAMARSKTAGWSVERVPGLDVPQALLGVLPLTLPGSIFADKAALAARLGRGSYRFTNGDKQYEMDLQTRQAPVEFGPEEEEDVLVQSPTGPVLARVPKSAAAAAPVMPFGSPWGWGGPPQQQQSTTDVAKVVVEAMKPFMELQTKLIESLNKKDDDGHSKWMLEVEKMKLDAAREDAKARAKEAEENRKAREAELKAQAALELAKAEKIAEANAKAAEAQAKAQMESAKLQAETAKEQARYAADASREQAKIMAEAQSKVAEAQIESAKARAEADRESLKAQMEMQRQMYEKMDEIRSAAQAPAAESDLSTLISVAPTIAQTIMQGLRDIRATPITLVGPAGTDGPQVQVAANGEVKAIQAPAAQTPEQKAEAEKALEAKKAEVEAGKKQLLDALATLGAGAERDLDPKTVADAIAKGAPRIHEWLKKADPITVLAEVEKVLSGPEFSDGDRATANIAKKQIENKVPWVLSVVTAIKGA